MYQMNIGADIGRSNWVKALGDEIKPWVYENGGVAVEGERNGRYNLSIALEKCPSKIKKIIKDNIKNLYLTIVKQEYLYGFIRKYATNDYLVKVYVRILQAFNTAEENSILNDSLVLYSNFALDGFYEFRLNELKSKWNELVGLSMDNSDLLQEDASFGMLLKYMLSCLPSKTDSVSVDYKNELFEIKTDKETRSAKNTDEVVFALVDLAPTKIFLSKQAGKTKLEEKIMGIFDASFV